MTYIVCTYVLGMSECVLIHAYKLYDLLASVNNEPTPSYGMLPVPWSIAYMYYIRSRLDRSVELPVNTFR